LKGETVAKQKVFLKKGILLGAFACALLVFCSNPTNQNLRWRTNIELPVSNSNFILGKQFKDLFGAIDTLKDFALLGINDSTVDGIYDTTPHTTAFSEQHKDTFSFVQKQDTLSDKTFQVTVGPIPLSSAGNISMTVPFGVAAGNLPADVGPITVSNTIALNNVRRITFDVLPANAQLSVRLTNNTGVNISGLTLSFPNILPSAPSQTVATIPAGSFRDIIINVAGQTIGTTVQAQVIATLKAGTVSAGASLGVEISMVGTKASSLIVMDSLISIADTFTNNYEISDSINIDYTDFDGGTFFYFLNNKTGLNLNILEEHHDLWRTSECVRENITTASGLSVIADSHDSLYYYGGKILDEITPVSARQNQKFGHFNLGSYRLFPTWNDSLSSSVSRVDYIIRTVPQPNGWDTINANDSLIFTIQAIDLHFSGMQGTLVKDINKTSDTQTVAIPFPFPSGDRDSLRGKFMLSRVLANMNLKMDLPDSAFLGGMSVKFNVLAPQFPGTTIDTNVSFGRIKKDTTYNRILNITKVVNNFPDSVKILTFVTIPKGTKIRAINDQTNVTGIGAMTIKSYADYKINAYFDWSVASLTTMDLGADTFTLDTASIRLFRKMETKTASFDFTVLNQTNVFIRLYALFAPDSMRALRLENDTLFPTDSLNDMVLTPGLAESHGYINLLGTTGVYIPLRNKSFDNSIALNNGQLNSILNTAKGAIRWMLQFNPSSPSDSLKNTDYINVKSSFHFEGVNNMDSLTHSF
jgi:hypothetical protein